jgi:hypothetical protein
MTNEKAIQVIKEKAKDGEQPERLAAMYAMDDIVTDDIDTWLNNDVSEYLMQFPDVARELADDVIKEGVSMEKLADGLCNVSASMYYYVKLYEILTSYNDSTVRTLTGRGAYGVQGDPVTRPLESDEKQSPSLLWIINT